ncbi:MAG: IMP cyclohydrolase [Patescibacteria group bacterium]|mgnify:FL=1
MIISSIPQPYPGRIVIIGKDSGAYVGIYAVTARSASSRAKRYVRHGDSVVVEATDEDVMAQGNLDLLSYTAMRWDSNHLVIGNGRQVDEVLTFKDNARDTLEYSLGAIDVEPDKYHTPRITGYIHDGHMNSGALHIVREKEGVQLRDVYEIPMLEGRGYGICTYAGPNTRPTQSFIDKPFEVPLSFGNTMATAESLYDSLEPRVGEEDLRVSVAVVYWKQGVKDIYITNAVDRI